MHQLSGAWTRAQRGKRQKELKEHKRCGTSFLLIVMVISILFFMVIRVDTIWLRIVSRIVLIPVIAGVSYEVLRLAGTNNSKIMDIVSRPGMWMQGLTTKEPDDSMIEVAIAAVEAVFDWKKYLEENFPEQYPDGYFERRPERRECAGDHGMSEHIKTWRTAVGRPQKTRAGDVPRFIKIWADVLNYGKQVLKGRRDRRGEISTPGTCLSRSSGISRAQYFMCARDRITDRCSAGEKCAGT